jgi:hypothetical protein
MRRLILSAGFGLALLALAGSVQSQSPEIQYKVSQSLRAQQPTPAPPIPAPPAVSQGYEIILAQPPQGGGNGRGRRERIQMGDAAIQVAPAVPGAPVMMFQTEVGPAQGVRFSMPQSGANYNGPANSGGNPGGNANWQGGGRGRGGENRGGGFDPSRMMMQFGGGGSSGGGSGGMGRMMMGGDPMQLFNMISQGKDVINRNDLPEWQQRMFDRMAPQLGITNGQLTRQQFQQAAEQMRSRMQGGGGGMGGMGAEQMDRFSDDRFRRSDSNGDGLMTINEMSERLRPIWQQFDSNKDGALDVNEYKGYFRSAIEQAQSNNAPQNPQQPGNQPPPLIPDMGSSTPEDDRRPTVYRAGKLPSNLPAWFEQTDFDRDGQIGIYEWVKTERQLEEFRGLDRNEDGLLTIEEVVGPVNQSSNSTTTPSTEMLAGGNGMLNGFSGFGVNGLMQFGDWSQDNRGRPGGRGRGGDGGGRGRGGDGGNMSIRGPGGGGPGGGGPGGRGRGGDNGFFGGGPGGNGFGGRGRGGDNNGGNGFFGGGNNGFGGMGGRGRGGDNGFMGGNGFGGPGGGGRNRGGDNGFGGGPGGRGRGGDNGMNRQDNGNNPDGGGRGNRGNRGMERPQDRP